MGRLQFNSFLGKKLAEDFNKRLVESSGELISSIGVVENYDIFKVVINPKAERTICFIAGVHGDEPAGPLGVLKFLEDHVYVPSTKRVIIIPLVNPTGFEARTRKNYQNLDLNREFDKKELQGEAKIVWDAIKNEKIDFLHTLHEDPEAKEWYMYHTEEKVLAEDLRDLAKKYFKIFDGKNKHPLTGEQDTIYDDKIYEGLIPLPHTRRGTIEDKIYDFHIPYIVTETPGQESLQKRIDFNRNAMRLVVLS